MSWKNPFKKKKKETLVKLQHYASEITITPVDYMLPDFENEYKKAVEKMAKFLSKTEPDLYCDSWFDKMADVMEQTMTAELLSQQKNHLEVIRNIVCKQDAELVSLNETIEKKHEMLRRHGDELESLIKLYADKNGGFVL